MSAACTKPQTYPSKPYTTLAATVIEYLPAPGQFIEDGWKAGTAEEACEWANQRLAEQAYVSLGAFGGYIVARLDYPAKKIAVVGNSTESSSEPAIVYVMADENNNRLPDDTWYEIKGSLYGSKAEYHSYSVTYIRPEEKGQDVKWTASNGETGGVPYSTYHQEASYYPSWVKEDSYTLTGKRLQSKAYDSSGNGTMWINPSYGSGYADNYNEADRDYVKTFNSHAREEYQLPAASNIFDVNDAVDSEGNPANIGLASFVKVQAAVQDVCGWIGEVSTEVCGIYALETQLYE